MSALSIAKAAVVAIDLEERVRASLGDVSWRGDPVILAIGKAAPAMARGALAIAPHGARAIVVTADGTDARGLDRDPRVRVLRASHPIPDARSIVAAEALLESAAGAGTCVALVSGGASSLVCAPARGLSFDDKRGVIAALLDAGAPIADVNTVRRHLSRIKGGGLARACRRVYTRIVSDVLVASPDGQVLEGAPHDIGSGPASPDPTSIDDARRVLERWAPAWVSRVGDLLVEGGSVPGLVDQRVVASPIDLVATAASLAREQGWSVEIAEPSLAPVDALAISYAERAKTLARGQMLLRVAEPSVALPEARGLGGRAGRLALSTWTRGLADDVELACVSSDGVDGSSGAAGAVVSGTLAGDALARAHEALARFDDGPFLASTGRAIPGAPTGSNLLDLHVLCRAR